MKKFRILEEIENQVTVGLTCSFSCHLLANGPIYLKAFFESGKRFSIFPDLCACIKVNVEEGKSELLLLWSLQYFTCDTYSTLGI